MKEWMNGWRFWALLGIGVVLVALLAVDIVLKTPFRADPAIWGNIAAWVTGTATVAVALLAARFAWESSQSAKRVVRLTAISAKVAFRCEVKRVRHVAGEDEDPSHFEYEIALHLTEDSTPCFLKGASFRPTRSFSFEENWSRNTLDRVWVFMNEGIHLSPGQSSSNVWEVDSLDYTAPDDPPGNKENTILTTVYYTLEEASDPTERPLAFNTQLEWIDGTGPLFAWI